MNPLVKPAAATDRRPYSTFRGAKLNLLLDLFSKNIRRGKVLSAVLDSRHQVQMAAVFRLACFTLTEVTFNLQIVDKVQLTINVSMN